MAMCVKGSTWTGFFPTSSHLTIRLRELAASRRQLLRNSRPVGTEVLFQANSAKERDDRASEGIIIAIRSTRVQLDCR